MPVQSKSEFGWPIIIPPKVGIIITHHNYSNFVEGAIDSVLNQTYSNYECVVVDDGSDQQHQARLKEIINKKSGQIRLICQNENLGQVQTFYTGFDSIEADFYCLLDPDDRYLPNFIEKMVALHLNPFAYVPFVGCDQIFLLDGRQVTGTRGLFQKSNQLGLSLNCKVDIQHKLRLFGPNSDGWHWASTSALMFRRGAVKLLRPNGNVNFKRQADAYLSLAMLSIGGCLIYDDYLVIRGIHSHNSWISDQILSSYAAQNKQNLNARATDVEIIALLNIIKNGGGCHLNKKHVSKKIKKTMKPLERIKFLLREKEIFKYVILKKLF